ncbi:MAG: septum formation initiator family protein [Deltaproteobacteria bacterium]|nr:MAG: septum formation initiator family protein [Deltaproteobacteria bacterium]
MARRQKKRKRGEMRGRSFLVVFGIFLLVLIASDIVFGHLGLREYVTLKRRHDALIAKRMLLEKEVRGLEAEVERLKSDMSYIEEIARRELGFVKEREKIIIIDE